MSRRIEFEDSDEDVMDSLPGGFRNDIGGPSSSKPRSRILEALDAQLGVAGGKNRSEVLEEEERESACRAKLPRVVPVKRPYFDPKPVLKPAPPATVVAPKPSKPPSTGRDRVLSGSNVLNSAKSTDKLKKTYSSTKVQVNLPLYNYRSKVFSDPLPIPKRLYVRDLEQANELAGKLDTSSALGFDLEWRVEKRKNFPQRPTAVLQICDKAMILIIQLSAMNGQFPEKLKTILEDRNVPKLGVNILNDGVRIGNDFGFRPHSLLELGGLARQADPGPRGYIEKYFRVTNPDYVDEYLAGLATSEPEEAEEEKENGSLKPADGDTTSSNKDAESQAATSTCKPRKPGAMIALATITAMYTQRSLDKGPVRSSNWEKEPLTDAQLDYAANDAHCALVVYQKLMKIAQENGVELDPERYTQDVKWYHNKKKPESTIMKSAPSSSSSKVPSSRTSSAGTAASNAVVPWETNDSEFLPLYDDDDVTMPEAVAPKSATSNKNTPSSSSSGLKPTPAFVKQRPQHIRSYNLWYGKNMPLDEMCKTLRSPDNPLKVGTVISYVVGALQADPSLRFSFEKIKALLSSEKASFNRHKQWFEALDGTENIHINMTR